MKALRWLLLLPALAFGAPQITISVNPATGLPPYPATIIWSVTGADACTASDGWTGTKALTGTQTVTVTAATKYTLTCTAGGVVHLSWIPPTTNTDGSTLTDLAGFNLYRGATASALAKVKSVGKAVTSYDDASLAAGTYVYAATAVNAASAESAKSATVSQVVGGLNATASATAAVQSVPNPPTGLIVTEITAYKMRQSPDAFSFVAIGTVPLGTACNSELNADGMHVVPRASIKLASKFDTLPLIVYAKCG